MKQEYELLVESDQVLSMALKLVGEQAAQLHKEGFEGYGLHVQETSDVWVVWMELTKYIHDDDENEG